MTLEIRYIGKPDKDTMIFQLWANQKKTWEKEEPEKLKMGKISLNLETYDGNPGFNIVIMDIKLEAEFLKEHNQIKNKLAMGSIRRIYGIKEVIIKR